jgi:hypothetical protein
MINKLVKITLRIPGGLLEHQVHYSSVLLENTIVFVRCDAPESEHRPVCEKFADGPCAKRGKHPTGSSCLVIGRYSTPAYRKLYRKLQILFEVGSSFDVLLYARMLMLRKRWSSCASTVRAH